MFIKRLIVSGTLFIAYAFQGAKIQKIFCDCKISNVKMHDLLQVLKRSALKPLYIIRCTYRKVHVEVYDRYMLGTCLNNIYRRKIPLYKDIPSN